MFILVVDDEKRYRELYAETLKKANLNVKVAENPAEAFTILEREKPAMIISDVRMPGMDGLTFLKEVKKSHLNMPFLLITAYADIKDAVNALKLGAVDYLEKPVDLDELLTAVHDTLGVENKGATPVDIPEKICRNIIAKSPVMQHLLNDIYRVAKSEANVLLTGETGVGKDVLANFIHNSSERASKNIVSLNCAAIPENLLAGELFGHEKGSFTGATTARKGLFRQADKGTLFLDEIGELPVALQSALLRAIETRKFTPVGSDKEVFSDFRLIAATNQNLEKAVKEGRFREDLYYRLNVIAFEIPPLRDRAADIIPLANFFLKQKGKKRLASSTAVMLQNYNWPGNIRELSNAIERAAILSLSEIILPEQFSTTIRSAIGTSRNIEASEKVKTIQEAELDAIRVALKKANGNRTKTAALLGLSRRALIYKIKQFDIEG